MKNKDKDYGLRCGGGVEGCFGDCGCCGFNASINGIPADTERVASMEVVGVKFRPTGKAYYFDPDGAVLPRGAAVIVETQRGVDYGIVELTNMRIPTKDVTAPIKKIVRQATKSDEEQLSYNKAREKEALVICEQKVGVHKLDMKLIDVALAFDRTKIVFYFTADGRVDFRELVKDLASVFRMRIELRQIGVRDEARMLNGIGVCGRELCCAKFLEDFQPVSIKMVKDQGLSPNPTKISGSCGRLMCCLKYEESTYEYLNSNMPSIGDFVRTPDGDGDVLYVSVLRQTVRVAVRNKKEEINITVYPASDVKILKKGTRAERSEE